MFHLALYEPCIAPNTGNIIRLIANNGCQLHLIEPLGFDFREKSLKRAGLDYHDLARVTRYKDYASFLQAHQGRRMLACTTKGCSAHDKVSYQKEDMLLFGSETSGLPSAILESFAPENRIRIPMLPSVRSMNLANAVAIVSYEAWRQLHFEGAC